MVKEYYIPESSELGQYLLDMSAMAGSLYDRRITKAELLDELSYLIDSARETKNNIKSAEYMKQYLASGDEDDWYNGDVRKMSFNDMVKKQRMGKL